MAESNPSLNYCPSCGEGVYTYLVHKDEGIETRCGSCGLPLGVESGAAPPQGLDCIMLTDDDRFFRSLLTDLLRERGLAVEVASYESGTSFLAAAAERYQQGLPVKLVILDIMMEPLDGIVTALALRAIEKGLKISPPAPVLFLSAYRCDDNMRKLMGQSQPSIYLNKGSDATPERLGSRLEKVIAYLLEGERK